MENKEVKTTGLGFVDALTILFIALKLTGVIDWKWIWVLSPIWISISVLILIVVIFLVVSSLLDR